jgi:glucans biosynthesis protein C
MQPQAILTPRRHDLDWLRVIAILCVFLFHTFRFFDGEDWHVKNAITWPWANFLIGFLVSWMMQLVFLISGASLWYAARRRGYGRYITDKLLRLAVPLVVAVFTHAALQVYLERFSHRQFTGSFFEFYPHYFEGVYIPGTPGNFAFHGMHLWYLLVLFVFSVLFVPLFFGLRAGVGGRVLARIGDAASLPGGLLLLVIPTILLQNFVGGDTAVGSLKFGGWSLVQYLWFLLAGYLVISHERLQARIRQARWVTLGLGFALIVLYVATSGSTGVHEDLLSWCFVLAFLGFGMKHLTMRTPFLDYASEAVLPFYILHQTVLLSVGFFVMPTALPDGAKYLLTAVASFALIVGCYEFLVRPFDVMRVLFGMHPLRRAAPAPDPLPTPVGARV